MSPPENSPGAVTMREVAQASGVSVSAVSLAMKNSAKVSPGKRAEILRVAERLGYRRDPRITELMEHLRTSRARRAPSHLAVLIPELTREEVRHNPRFLALIAGIREVAGLGGYAVDLFYLADPGMTPRRIRSILVARGIKGVVVAPFNSGAARLDFDFTGLCASTAGYSIVEPRLHRACPDYLQMMDELIEDCVRHGYRRIGLVMTYTEGGIGHKLFTSSFLYYQSLIPEARRVPVLPKPEISPANLSAWLDRHKPDVVVSAGSVYRMLLALGRKIPRDLGFASIDISEEPVNAAGADHRHTLVGREAAKLVLSSLGLNLTGVPPNPKVVLADSHQHAGFTLRPQTAAARRAVAGRKRETPAPAAAIVPDFHEYFA
ncbi:MAG: LacI family transcriptional regulator [Opitutaceae bacterium]|jgi:LacI family transcriptional regulator|nr:LacI family transcriptional regulator [Opitutaceae bacterium]